MFAVCSYWSKQNEAKLNEGKLSKIVLNLMCINNLDILLWLCNLNNLLSHHFSFVLVCFVYSLGTYLKWRVSLDTMI